MQHAVLEIQAVSKYSILFRWRSGDLRQHVYKSVGRNAACRTGWDQIQRLVGLPRKLRPGRYAVRLDGLEIADPPILVSRAVRLGYIRCDILRRSGGQLVGYFDCWPDTWHLLTGRTPPFGRQVVRSAFYLRLRRLPGRAHA